MLYAEEWALVFKRFSVLDISFYALYNKHKAYYFLITNIRYLYIPESNKADTFSVPICDSEFLCF